MSENGDVSFLSPEYQEILNQADTISREQKNSPGQLEFLRGLYLTSISQCYAFEFITCKTNINLIPCPLGISSIVTYGITNCLVLTGIVTDLLVDTHKLKGKSIQGKVTQLGDILEKNYTFDSLMALFAQPKSTK